MLNVLLVDDEKLERVLIRKGIIGKRTVLIL